jgi:hypothetical protein
MRKDLKLHFIIGAIIAAAVTMVSFYFLKGNVAASMSLGVIAATIAGYVKEYFWDAKGHGTVDHKDFEYTCIGGIVGALIVGVIGSW